MRVLFIVLLFSSLNIHAQSKKDSLLKAIDKEVWLPFLKGVNTDVDDLYIDVHSKDFFWTLGGQRTRIMNFNEYAEDSKAVMGKRRDSGTITKMDVRFLERNVNEAFAAEKCIFKYSSQKKGAEPTISYGIALIFSRKEKEGWKMLVQYVSKEEANEKLFQSAATLNVIPE